MAFSSAFQPGAFQSDAFQVVDDGRLVDLGAGDIATPEEIRYLKRRDRIAAWQQARQERQKSESQVRLDNLIDMGLRGPGAADPMDAAEGERGPTEKSDQTKKPVGVPATEYAHSLLAETIEKDITPPPQLPPSPESHQRIARYATEVSDLFKRNLDAEVRSSANVLAQLAAFSADHNQVQADTRRSLASFR